MHLILRAARNPLTELGDLLSNERLSLIGHPRVGIRAGHAADEFALGGLARDDGRLARLHCARRHRAVVESKPVLLLVRPVTLEAVLRENGPDVAGEIDRIGGKTREGQNHEEKKLAKFLRHDFAGRFHSSLTLMLRQRHTAPFAQRSSPNKSCVPLLWTSNAMWPGWPMAARTRSGCHSSCLSFARSSSATFTPLTHVVSRGSSPTQRMRKWFHSFTRHFARNSFTSQPKSIGTAGCFCGSAEGLSRLSFARSSSATFTPLTHVVSRGSSPTQ